MIRRRLAAAALLALALPFTAQELTAQWPTGPATNLPIGDGAGEQALPKIAATADGGCYIAWFDNAGGSYAVRLQRLDAAGVEQWAHGGVLVSNQPQQSSLVDWELIADSAGGAVLTFCDVRNGPDLDVYAYRYAPNGMPAWGANGVTLSSNADFEAAPQVAEIGGGNFVFAWTRSLSGGGGTIEVQLLDAGGNPQYLPSGLSIAGDPGASPAFVDVAATDSTGGFALCWVRDLAFIGNKHLHAQKFNAAGVPQWGTSRLAVFDSSSLPIAYQPQIAGDGAGGAWIAWHFSQGAFFTARAQRVDAAGLEVFPHNGVDVSTEASMSRLTPAIARDPQSGDLLVGFQRHNSGQALRGASVQRIAQANGARLWTDSGAQVSAVDTADEVNLRVTPFGGGVMAHWIEQPSGSGQDTIRAARVDAAGMPAWTPTSIAVASIASDKLKLVASSTSSGVAVLAWSDGRTDSGDVYAQSVNPNGTLGADLATAQVYGSGVNPAGSMTTSGLPRLGTTVQLRVDNPAGTQAVGSLPFVLFATAPDPAFPAGASLPGFGMAAPGAAGELLIVTGAVLGGAFQAPAWLGAGSPSTLPVPVPLLPALVGGTLYAQALFVDLSPGAMVPLGLTDAAALRVGF